MNIKAWVCAAIAFAGVSAAAQAFELSFPPVPPKSAAKIFDSAPQPWHDYFVKVRAAEQIADPLQRCLAFPDLPGNHWPQGHAAAHCRFHAQHDVPALRMDAIADDLVRGKESTLNAKLDRYLRKHDDKNGLNEEIHAIFEQFGEDDRGDDVSSRWLQKAPESAYANLARGSYLVGRAWRMRGKQSAAQTPDTNFENMHALLDRAIPLLQKAVALNPRLVPADIELMSAGMLGGRADVAEAAFAAAQKQSPACLVLVQQRMQSLLPRWGGSLEQEEAYKSELMPYLDRHPAIAIYFSMSIHDQATALFYNYGTSTHDDFYKTGSATLLDHAVDIGSYDEALHDAGDVALNRADAPADDWRGFALLLQEARFKYGNVWADKTISWQLLHDEPEWALHYLVRAEQIEPTDPELQYMLGAANYNAHRYNEAQRHYDMAILDPGQQQAALRESSSMWLQNAALSPRQQAAKAMPYVDRLLSEYPNDGRGWVYHFNCLGKLGEIVSTEQIRKFLLVADRTDPVQARAISTSESILGRKRDK